MPPFSHGVLLNKLYKKFNHPKHIHPDPLQWVLEFQDPRDQEIAALIASSLAYGNVKQILGNLTKIFGLLLPTPALFVAQNTPVQMRALLVGFKHRWHTGDDMAALLGAIQRVYQNNDSLLDLFLQGYRSQDQDILPALNHFVGSLKQWAPHPMRANLLPDPGAQSACKRLNMFLRWMVRHDKIDTGLWRVIPASKLLVPLDTHMHKISLALGLTRRKQADLRTVVEITDGFKKISPTDPVRYDFCLTRLGINRSASIKTIRKEFLEKI